MDESTQQQLREYPPPWSARTVPGVHGMTMLDIVDAGGKTVQTTVDHPAVRPRVALIVEAVNAYAAQQEQAAPSADAAAWQALAALGAQKDEDGGPVWTVEVSIYQGRVKVRLRHSDTGLSVWSGGNTLAEAWLSASQRAEVEGKERMP